MDLGKSQVKLIDAFVLKNRLAVAQESWLPIRNMDVDPGERSRTDFADVGPRGNAAIDRIGW